jgi:glycyl-tRNA synthetase
MPGNSDDVMELALRRGFIWPSFEIYGGVAGFYDYGPLGSILKNKIIERWRRLYVIGEGCIEIDTPTLTPFEVLKASGHVDHFLDAMVECKKCGSTFKVVDLVKDASGEDVEGKSKAEMEEALKKHGIRCADCGGELGEVFEFNAMFKTAVGPGSKRTAFLRPETAQGIFIDFRRLYRHARGKLPLGVVQIGKGYRNEVSPRQGMIRLREFTMAETEVFFDPKNPNHPNFPAVAEEKLHLWLAKDQVEGKEELIEISAEEAVKRKLVCNQLMGYYLALTKRFLVELGIPENAIRFREQTPGQRAHYSKETWDAEVFTKRYGWVEVTGIAYRTDYDLSGHMGYSKEDLTAFIEEEKRRVVCHVVEPSYGIDRPFYCVLEHAWTKEGKRKLLKLKKYLAPIEAGVFPLITRDGLPEKAREVEKHLKAAGFLVEYDDSGSIGRRYARADEIGTPYCITIDHQTLEDGTVTIRDRDTTKQIRVGVEDLQGVLGRLLRDEISFEEAGQARTRTDITGKTSSKEANVR